MKISYIRWDLWVFIEFDKMCMRCLACSCGGEMVCQRTVDKFRRKFHKQEYSDGEPPISEDKRCPNPWLITNLFRCRWNSQETKVKIAAARSCNNYTNISTTTQHRTQSLEFETIQVNCLLCQFFSQNIMQFRITGMGIYNIQL